METPTTRKCAKCKIVKPLEEFARDRSDTLGKQGRCKPCGAESSRAWLKAHPGYSKKKGKERYNKAENSARYEMYRDDYLRRIRERRQTPRGKLLDLLGAAKTRTKKSGQTFELTIEWALARFEAQQGTCLLTGIPFTFNRNDFKVHFQWPFSMSIDRIDSNLGYTEDNSRLVCVIVNLALNKFGDKAFATMCEGYLATRNRS